MKYALWNLKIEADNYLSGPEQTIVQAGAQVETAWTDGFVENGATILGYIYGDFVADLSAWNYKEITQNEALAFCQALDSSAMVDEFGKIITQ